MTFENALVIQKSKFEEHEKHEAKALAEAKVKKDASGSSNNWPTAHTEEHKDAGVAKPLFDLAEKWFLPAQDDEDWDVDVLGKDAWTCVLEKLGPIYGNPEWTNKKNQILNRCFREIDGAVNAKVPTPKECMNAVAAFLADPHPKP
jgi:hypothetical protein